MNLESGLPHPDLGEKKTVPYEILANPDARGRLKERVRSLTEQIHDRRIGAVVFLDKSARPFSWMASEIWKKRYEGEKMPEVRFLNMGTASYENDGAARRLIGKASEIPWYLSGDVARNVGARDLMNPDAWLSAADVPGQWQERIVEHVEELARLEETYRKSFDGRDVLIVDDFVATGQSILAALAVMNAAFPRAEFRATALFKSAGIGKAADRARVPWLSVPGMSGVLELPESNLVSARMTEADVERVRARLRDKLQECMREPLYAMERFEETRDRFFALAESLSEKIGSRAVDALRARAEVVGGFVQKIRMEGTPEAVPSEAFEKACSDLFTAAYAIRNGLSADEYDAMQRRVSDFSSAVPRGYPGFESACDIAWLLGPDGYASMPELLRRARQLRAEVTQLANEA